MLSAEVTSETLLGTFDHDGVIEAHAKNSDGVSITNSYKLLETPSYAYDDFRITENNQLSFIGASSGVLGTTPPYKLNVETTTTVAIDLPSTFDGYIDVDASTDDADADKREFAFSGGAISQTDKTNHRTIVVEEGMIYAPDTNEGIVNIITFKETEHDLPTTAGIYKYHVIVTDEDNDGTGEISVVSTLPTTEGTKFYVIGTAEAFLVPETGEAKVRVDDLIFFAKVKGEAGNNIKLEFVLNSPTNVTVGVETADDITTITVNYGAAHSLANLKTAIDDDPEANTLVEVSLVSGGDDTTEIDAGVVGTGATLTLTGGVEQVYTQTATIGNIEVTITPTTSNDLLIKTISTGTAPQPNDATATIEIADGITTITVRYDGTAKVSHIMTALNGLDGVTATLASGTADDDPKDLLRINYPMTGGDASNAGSATIAGLTVTADSTGTGGNYKIIANSLESAGTAVAINISTDNTAIVIGYQIDATLAHLKTAIDALTGSKDVISTSIPDMAAYDDSVLLIDIFGVTTNEFTVGQDAVLVTGDSPTANPTGTQHNTGSVYSYEADGTLPPEDYIIN